MPFHTGMLSVCQRGRTEVGLLKRPLPGSRRLLIAPSRMLPKISQMTFVSEEVLALQYGKQILHLNMNGTVVHKKDENDKELTQNMKIKGWSEILDGVKFVTSEIKEEL